MATVYKVLAQSNPSVTTNTDIYTVPSATSAVLSTITVCNQSSSQSSYRIAIRPGGASLAAVHYIAYDVPLQANDTTALTLGITLAATDVVTIYATTSSVSFSLFGSEVS
jgi:hypothetical protein